MTGVIPTQAASYWIDGELCASPRVPFDLSDRGLTLGDGAFDTAFVLDGRVFRREAHLGRLLGALETLGIEGAGERARRCMDDLAPHGARHVLRVAVTRGPGLRGLLPAGPAAPTVFGALTPFPADSFGPRLRLDVAAIRRNESSPLSRLKTPAYLDAALALREAARRGCNEALFLNGAGRVACASIGNVFALFGARLATPPTGDGALPGIIRGFLLEEAGALGLEAQERPLTLEELRDADAAFMTNSLRLIAPIDSIGGHELATRGAGVVSALQDLLRRAILEECGASP